VSGLQSEEKETMSKQYVVWVTHSDNTPECYRNDMPAGVWEPNGDGPMGPKTAERVAREIHGMAPGIRAKALPVGQRPLK